MATVLNIHTKNKRKQLTVNIYSDYSNKRLLIIGYDANPNIVNSDYFRRELFLERGDNQFVFNMPTSPKELEILVFNPKDENDDSWYKISSVTTADLKQFPLITDRLTKDFVLFSEQFSKVCGYKPVGDYTDSKKQFLIKIKNQLLDEKGNIVPTPARTHKTLDYIEVHKASYDSMTVPMRHIISLHEYCHNFLNDERDNEIQADINALSLYMPLRYSYVEAMYAFTNIFGDNDTNVERLNYIDNYLKENNLEKRNSKQQYFENYNYGKNLNYAIF